MAVTQLNSVAEIFDLDEIHPVFQPIVDVTSGQEVGAEALARWPGLGVGPDVAFEMARRQGRVAELDVQCQRAALRDASDVALPAGFKLFVNVEPGQSVAGLGGAGQDLELVVEITERALADRPADLMRHLRALRASGMAIALDDVGAVPDSLALLPFIEPDVVKLDMSLIQRRPGRDQARILTAVNAYAERSGARILAEGVETERHLDQAMALGATWVQGWYFGRPGPLRAHGGRVADPLRTPHSEAPPATPFDLVEPARQRVASKRLLLGFSLHIEQQGMTLETPPVVLSAFQDRSRFTPATAERYRRMAERCPLVAALGTGMSDSPAPGVRGGDLADDDRLAGEWTVVVVGTHYTGALIAKDLGDGGPDLDRRYLFTITHDPRAVRLAAASLLGRITGVTRASVEPFH